MMNGLFGEALVPRRHKRQSGQKHNSRQGNACGTAGTQQYGLPRWDSTYVCIMRNLGGFCS